MIKMETNYFTNNSNKTIKCLLTNSNHTAIEIIRTTCNISFNNNNKVVLIVFSNNSINPFFESDLRAVSDI